MIKVCPHQRYFLYSRYTVICFVWIWSNSFLYLYWLC